MSDITEARKRWEKANTVGASAHDIRESWMDVPVLIKEIERLCDDVERLRYKLAGREGTFSCQNCAELSVFLADDLHAGCTFRCEHCGHAHVIAPESTERLKRKYEEEQRLRAIVDRLPVTADGVPVIPNASNLYELSGDACIGEWILTITGWCMYDYGEEYLPVSSLYSTREAAEAATKET